MTTFDIYVIVPPSYGCLVSRSFSNLLHHTYVHHNDSFTTIRSDAEYRLSDLLVISTSKRKTYSCISTQCR
jgi:hypothetical protein